MVNNSNVLVLVGAGENPNFSQRKLMMWTTETNSVFCETSFLYKVEGVCVNKSKYFPVTYRAHRLVAYVKDKVHIYNSSNMKFLHSLELNSMQGKLALSPSSENCYLAYSNSLVKGTVAIFDMNAMSASGVITAHKTSVLKLAINFYGTLLVTCSGKV